MFKYHCHRHHNFLGKIVTIWALKRFLNNLKTQGLTKSRRKIAAYNRLCTGTSYYCSMTRPTYIYIYHFEPNWSALALRNF